MGVYIAAFFVAAFLALVVKMVIGTRRTYECDLCGRQEVCVVWEGSKGSAGHVCQQCIDLEDGRVRCHFQRTVTR
jgi:hypothetical protein